MRQVGWAVLSMVVACGDEPEVTSTTSTDGETDGACGDVTSIDVTIVGSVEGPGGVLLAGVQVTLEERNWSPGEVHGGDTTDSSGAFSLVARGLPVVEGCWGTAVQFWLEGVKDELYGEKPMNHGIIGAYDDGSLFVDLGAFPLLVD